MILDRLERCRRYACLGKPFERAFAYLAGTDFSALPDGRRSIDGERLFALLQTYRTRAPGEVSFETHRHHVDVQLFLQGAETIYWLPADDLDSLRTYNEETDAAWYADPPLWDRCPVALTAGLVGVYFPDDAHKPCCHPSGGPQTVRKVVVKVRWPK
ncbi:MAG: YhcH/YjgK/YiaL family protein [Spirochaetales bacterium]|nr:YhcH/YjgK/YiaL family protein [Spirochaetales bacterium]